jgi:hypothetical protein
LHTDHPFLIPIALPGSGILCQNRIGLFANISTPIRWLYYFQQVHWFNPNLLML